VASPSSDPPAEPGRLASKVGLVTGAGSGLGRCIARRLVRDGAKVVLFDLSESVYAMAQEIGSASRALVGDVRAPGDAAAAVALAREQFGGLDILVNGAGVIHEGGVVGTSPDEWRRLLDVNVTGVFLMSQAALPHLRPGGAIINIASVAAFRPRPTYAAYSVTKAAVVMLTQCLALELAPRRVRVNAISPGVIPSTGLVTSWTDREGVLDQMARTTPLGRHGTEEEVAALTSFLLSEDASWITGGIYPIDGGRAIAT
jgi:3-oxoacyl-[acyl-carrier protein] reductase